MQRREPSPHKKSNPENPRSNAGNDIGHIGREERQEEKNKSISKPAVPFPNLLPFQTIHCYRFW